MTLGFFAIIASIPTIAVQVVVFLMAIWASQSDILWLVIFAIPIFMVQLQYPWNFIITTNGTPWVFIQKSIFLALIRFSKVVFLPIVSQYTWFRTIFLSFVLFCKYIIAKRTYTLFFFIFPFSFIKTFTTTILRLFGVFYLSITNNTIMRFIFKASLCKTLRTTINLVSFLCGCFKSFPAKLTSIYFIFYKYLMATVNTTYNSLFIFCNKLFSTYFTNLFNNSSSPLCHTCFTTINSPPMIRRVLAGFKFGSAMEACFYHV